jgi:inosine-uridine nucleoside N-ribohydrolase
MRGQRGGVGVDVLPGPNEGRLTADWWGVAKPPLPQALILTEIDADGFFARLCDRLLRFK